MDEKTLTEILNGVKNIWRNPRGIHFAGGEVFLNFPLLLNAVKMALELDILIEFVETNAAWCIDESDIYEKFHQLKEAGLERMLISCSPFHAERFPLERVIKAIKIALDVFGRYGVIVYKPYCIELIAQFSITETVPVEAYIQKYGLRKASRFIWYAYGIIPGGRSGYKLGHLIEKKPADVFEGQNCLFEILMSRHAHFDLYGNYIPYFCGGLNIGDSRNLPKLLQNFTLDERPITRMLVDGGPWLLYRFAKDRFGYRQLPDGYAGKCHLCVDVRKYLLEKTDNFWELAPAQFYKMF
jgi:hypothetical protein